MGVTAAAERIFLRTSVALRKTLVRYSEMQNIRKKRSLIDSVALTKEQEDEIDEYFLKYYGKKVPYDWHRLYQSYTGAYHKNYFPEILFSTELEPRTNPYRTAELLGDKNLLEPFFNGGGVHIPRTILSSVRGNLRDQNGHLISEEEAGRILERTEKCVIKKTVETSSGRDVQIIKCPVSDGVQALRAFGKDYVVQEQIEQLEKLKRFNPDSLNTFRVMTYILDHHIYVCPVALRLGRHGADKDNIHYGGISVGVNEDGTLTRYAFSEYGEKFDRHPDSGVVFEGYKIEEAGRKIRDTAVRLHERMPYLGILSWDLSIDSEGEIVLIEVNTTGQSAWFCQMVNGKPLFGENTPKMLEKIKRKSK